MGFRSKTHAHRPRFERSGWTLVCMGLGPETVVNGAPHWQFSPLTQNPATTLTELGREPVETGSGSGNQRNPLVSCLEAEKV
jgi:hypothetical protein